ncbi:uncharacterized protein LOC131930092 [Physella acuta]|uniref:uncharacterized protein LOC131930092 n=1 Tax=Physella acuta TaxID=109671 RepID=UPI0027DC48AA|nr:uncharacterized protein LOC131930092 [Physella acuta]XP_059142435.1 uncharacterized protein LOC131930092 [Physella acuta]
MLGKLKAGEGKTSRKSLRDTDKFCSTCVYSNDKIQTTDCEMTYGLSYKSPPINSFEGIPNSENTKMDNFKDTVVITPPPEFIRYSKFGEIDFSDIVKKAVIELLDRGTAHIYLLADKKGNYQEASFYKCSYKAIHENGFLKFIPSIFPPSKDKSLFKNSCKVNCESKCYEDAIQIKAESCFINKSDKIFENKKLPMQFEPYKTSFEKAVTNLNKVQPDMFSLPQMPENKNSDLNLPIVKHFRPTHVKENENASCRNKEQELIMPYHSIHQLQQNSDQSLSALSSSSSCKQESGSRPKIFQGNREISLSLDVPLYHWTKYDVNNWLTENGFDKFVKEFSDLDGPCLVELIHCFNADSEVIQHHLKTLGFTFHESLMLSSHLRLLANHNGIF